MPRHKKKKRAANAAAGSVKRRDWLVGDLVVVKLRGHRPWPAQIQKPEDYGYDARPHRIFVTFYGTDETCFCSYNKITPFTSAMRKTLAEQLQKINTNPELERAIKEIFAADDELKKSRDNSRHKEDELGSEKSEGGVSPVERTRKRGRAVEEECTADVVVDRSAKQEKTVKKMAAEQVHKLPRKVRIKVSTQQSDSPNNQQADSGALLGSEKASVSSSDAPSGEVSPRRTSNSNDRVEVTDAPSKKDVRATSVHDAVQLADASEKKNARATSGRKGDSELKDDVAKVATKVTAKHGVQNHDDGNDQMDTGEGSLEKESVAVREDVEKMDVDDQKMEELKVTGESSENGKQSDSVDHGVQGSNDEEPKKKSSFATDQHQSDHAGIPLSATVILDDQTVVKGDAESNKSTDSGDRDVSEGQSGVKRDVENDHQNSLEFVPKVGNEGSAVTKVLKAAASTPHGQAAGVKQDGGTNVAGSVSAKQEDPVPSSGDDSKEQQISEPSVLEKPDAISTSTTTSAASDVPPSTREAVSKEPASVQASVSSSRPNGDLLSGKDPVKASTIQDEVIQKGQVLKPSTKTKVEVSTEDQCPSSTTQGVPGRPILADQVPALAKQDEDVPGDVVMSDEHGLSATTSVLPESLPRETITDQVPGQSEERLGSDHRTTTTEKQFKAGESLVTSHTSGDDSTKVQVLDDDTDMTEARDDDSVKTQSTDLTQRGVDDAVKTQSTDAAQGGDDTATIKTQSTIAAGGDDVVVKTQSTDTVEVPVGDGLKSHQTSIPQALVEHEVKTQSTDAPQRLGDDTVSTPSTKTTKEVADLTKTQSTDKDSRKTESADTDSAKTQASDKDAGKTRSTVTDSAKTQSTDKESEKTQSTGTDLANTQTVGKNSVTEALGEACVVKDAVREDEKVKPSRADDVTSKLGASNVVDVSGRDVSVEEAIAEGEKVLASSGKVVPPDGEQASIEALQEAPTKNVEVPSSPLKGAADGEKVLASPVEDTGTNKEDVLVAPVKGTSTDDEEKITVSHSKDTRSDDEKASVSTELEASIADEKTLASPVKEAIVAETKVAAAPVKETTLGDGKS